MPISRKVSRYAQATAFYITTFAQLFFSFACRSHWRTLPQLGLFSNPYLLGAIVLSSVMQLLAPLVSSHEKSLLRLGADFRL